MGTVGAVKISVTILECNGRGGTREKIMVQTGNLPEKRRGGDGAWQKTEQTEAGDAYAPEINRRLSRIKSRREEPLGFLRHRTSVPSQSFGQET